MRLQDWWNGLDWQTMYRSQWTSTPHPLDWLNLGDWNKLSPDDWAEVPRAEIFPRYPPVSLSVLGFSQDNNFIYLPLESLPRVLNWSNLTLAEWLTLSNWNFPLLDADQLFARLILKLQSASLPVHTVRRSSNLFVIESRAIAITPAFDSDNY